MKAPKEIREWVNGVRSWAGKGNGVIPHLWDEPEMERKLATSKRNYRRNHESLALHKNTV